MKNKWNNSILEFLAPKKLIVTIGFLIIFIIIMAILTGLKEKKNAEYFGDEIQAAQEYIDKQEYEKAYQTLAEAYRGNRTKSKEILAPLISEGEELLKTATSGVFGGYGLPFEGRYDIKSPGYVYFLIPQEGEELFEENCYYMAWCESELSTWEEIRALFQETGSRLTYWDIQYHEGLATNGEPYINIRARENTNNCFYMQGTFWYDYSSDQIRLSENLILNRLKL